MSPRQGRKYSVLSYACHVCLSWSNRQDVVGSQQAWSAWAPICRLACLCGCVCLDTERSVYVCVYIHSYLLVSMADGGYACMAGVEAWQQSIPHTARYYLWPGSSLYRIRQDIIYDVRCLLHNHHLTAHPIHPPHLNPASVWPSSMCNCLMWS
jgi:hypothetical protein